MADLCWISPSFISSRPDLQITNSEETPAPIPCHLGLSGSKSFMYTPRKPFSMVTPSHHRLTPDLDTRYSYLFSRDSLLCPTISYRRLELASSPPAPTVKPLKLTSVEHYAGPETGFSCNAARPLQVFGKSPNPRSASTIFLGQAQYVFAVKLGPIPSPITPSPPGCNRIRKASTLISAIHLPMISHLIPDFSIDGLRFLVTLFSYTESLLIHLLHELVLRFDIEILLNVSRLISLGYVCSYSPITLLLDVCDTTTGLFSNSSQRPVPCNRAVLRFKIPASPLAPRFTLNCPQTINPNPHVNRVLLDILYSLPSFMEKIHLLLLPSLCRSDVRIIVSKITGSSVSSLFRGSATWCVVAFAFVAYLAIVNCAFAVLSIMEFRSLNVHSIFQGFILPLNVIGVEFRGLLYALDCLSDLFASIYPLIPFNLAVVLANGFSHICHVVMCCKQYSGE